jgi:ribosome-associated translation inhibitor RaiA
MQIRISGINAPITAESRAYAAYRFFTSIARYESRVGSVDVVVGREAAAGGRLVCIVAVDLGRSGHVKTQARSRRPSAAIDRAADRTAWLIGRRIRRDFSVKSSAFSS